MLLRIKDFFLKIGLDGAVFYTVLSRLVQAGGGVISILFIARYLTKVEQGYYYTFGSILAIQIFFELGLTGIIVQYVAHEKASLTIKDNIIIIGDEKSLSRLSSLLRFCIKWFIAISCILFGGLIIAGFYFFNSYGLHEPTLEWELPWLILAFSTAINLTISPILAFLEGLGKIKEVAKIRLYQQIVQIFGLFSFLMIGAKLFASPIASLLSIIIPVVIINFSSIKKLLVNIWYSIGDWKVDYKLEIFPYQWKIALSWISGYFMFQLFNPVVFATEGAKIAGQMGMTLALLNGVLSVSVSWISTKVPIFSSLIANKNYKGLDTIFNKVLFQACSVCLTCLIIICLVIHSLQYYNYSEGERFLPLYLVILLSICTFVNQLISALATYLRCHKKEPFMIYSIVMGTLTASSMFIFGHLFGINGIVGGYAMLTIFLSLTWSYRIFKTKRHIWHEK